LTGTLVLIADDAIEQLAEHVDAEALIVMDANTEAAAGERARGALPGAREHVFPQRSGLIAGIEEIGSVRRRAHGAGTLVAVGAGVITDIVRYAAYLEDLEFVSVPTAASMDGYASSVAALQLGGVKVTRPAMAPRAILADPRVAAAAPAELTRSGIGDLLAKATARVDWLAAHLLYGEPFCERAAAMMLEPLRFAVSHVERLLGGEPDAVSALLSGLVQSGLSITLAGSSRPASGCEHHASHFWDLLAARGIREHAPHGLQVGYASHYAMRLQLFAFGGGLGELARPVLNPDPLDSDARAWLGEPTDEIIDAVAEKQRFIAAVPARWPVGTSDWGGICAQLAGALELFEGVRGALEAAAIPAEHGYLGLDEVTLAATFRYASRLRARYTVIDFLEGQGALDAAVRWMLAGDAYQRS
jgi:glycerol-1-phosphate dehydrogenase [NAD(P)+]